MHLYGLIRRASKSPDTSHVPVVCYDQCISAYTEAHQVGKAPGLCNAISPFQGNYRFCAECVATKSGNETAPALQTFVVPEFSEYISYCANLTNESSPQEQRSIVASQASQNVDFSSILAQASANGTLKAVTTTTTSGNTATGITIQTPGPTTTPSLSNNTNGSQLAGSNRAAAIAGAVIGPVILITIILTIFAWWKRKKRIERNLERQPKTGEQPVDKVERWDEGGFKAQLHGDSYIPHELEADMKVHEFEGDCSPVSPLEKGCSDEVDNVKYLSSDEVWKVPRRVSSSSGTQV
ncbi:hypothetical protein BGZ60DRAFT_396833 [Tricladium varicosporioides]|nr:hypothetical protein BGZ60DRAFT_396833 [Hymenoscyphus varicosporioides]